MPPLRPRPTSPQTLTAKQKTLMVAQYAETLAATDEAFVIAFIESAPHGGSDTWIAHNIADGFDIVAENIRGALLRPTSACHRPNQVGHA